jgi:hypothetical protein
MLLLFYGTQFFLVGSARSNLYCLLLNDCFFICNFLLRQNEIFNTVVHLLRVACAA